MMQYCSGGSEMLVKKAVKSFNIVLESPKIFTNISN
jgi:hypothetical protein